MLTTRELLAAAKAHSGIPSNYRLARVLDVPETTVQRWNTGRSRPDDEWCAKLAELAGLDAGEVVASIRAERASDPQMRELWQSIADRLHAAGASALAVILSVLWLGSSAGEARASARAADEVPAQVRQLTDVYIVAHALRGAAAACARWIRQALQPLMLRPAMA